VPAHPLLVRGARCGLPLMHAGDVQFQPASQIPGLLAYAAEVVLPPGMFWWIASTRGQASLPVGLVSSLPASRSPHKIGNARYPPVLGDQLVHLQRG